MTACMLQSMLRPAADADRDAVPQLGVAEEDTWFGTAESSAEEVAEWVEDEGERIAACERHGLRQVRSSGRDRHSGPTRSAKTTTRSTR